MARSATHVVLRIALAVIGGYAVASGLVALLSVGLPPMTGMARSEAVILSSMLGFLLYLAILVWAFAARRLLWLAVEFLALIVACYGAVALVLRFRALV